MAKFKKLLSLVVAVVMVLSMIPAVSAAEETETTTPAYQAPSKTYEAAEWIEVSTGEDLIVQMKNGANVNATANNSKVMGIRLTDDITLSNETTGMKKSGTLLYIGYYNADDAKCRNQTLVFDLNGHTLKTTSDVSLSRLFGVYGTADVGSNFTLTNGILEMNGTYTAYSPVAFFHGAAKVTLDGVKVTLNDPSARATHGGMFYIANSKSTLDIINSDLIVDGGDTGSVVKGGIVNTGAACTITLKNSNFTGGRVTGGVVSDATHHAMGGQFYILGSTKFTAEDCTFTGGECVPAATSYKDYGGQIYKGSGSGIFKLTNCTFTGGSAERGAQIYYEGTSTSNVFENCTFTGGVSSSWAGSLYNGGRLTLNDCTFTGNHGSNGGAVFNTGSYTTTYNSCTFDGNSANTGGSMSKYGTGTVIFNDVDMNGTASGNGGALNVCNGTVILNSGSIHDGVAKSTSNGGGNVYIGRDGTDEHVYGTFIMNGGSINDGKAAYGANVRIYHGRFIMNDGFVDNGVASKNGHCIHIYSSSIADEVYDDAGTVTATYKDNFYMFGGKIASVVGATDEKSEICGGQIGNDVSDIISDHITQSAEKDRYGFYTISHIDNDTTVVNTPATCTTAGSKTTTCETCTFTHNDVVYGGTFEIEIPATGHTEEIIPGKDATCTDTGLTDGTKCSVCGEILTAQEEIAAAGHAWDEGVVTTDPTCNDAGVKTYTCATCGETKTEVVSATGHTPVTDEAVAPDCTNTGLTEGIHCDVCGEVIVAQEEIAALGHSYTGVYTEATTESNAYTTYTCSVCGDSYVETHEGTQLPSITGTGTQEDPYQIGTKEELFYFAEKVNDGTFKNVYAVLTDNIDLEQDDWTSIGTASNPFTGTFDGQGNTIYNLWCYERGLFGYTSTGNYVDSGVNGRAVIKNLTVENAEVYNQSTSAVGGIVGQAGQNTVLDNVTLTGYIQIWGYGYVGGIVGQGYVHVNNCHVDGIDAEDSEINAAYWAVAGIVGHAGSEGGSAITNCSVKNVTIYSTYYGAGSIAGVGTSGTIENVTAENVSICAHYGADDNGVLVGCNYNAITGNSTATNVTLVVDDVQVTAPQDMVAKVGNTMYATLQAAIDAAQEGETVTVLTDIVLTQGITVAADDEIILDLAGCTVSMEDASGKAAQLIKNNGDLTVMDSLEGGKLTFVSTTPSASNSYSTSTIINVGELKILSGTVENTTASGPSYAIDNAWYTEDVSLSVEGGVVTAVKPAIRQVLFSTTAKNTVNISGGEISGYAGLQVHNFQTTACLSDVNISGGTFNGSYAFYTSYSYNNTATGTNIAIDGGTFNGYVFLYNGNAGSAEYPMTISVTGGTFNDGYYAYCKDADSAEVSIPSVTGGTFAYDVSDYCVDGYGCTESTDGTYGIHKHNAVTDEAVEPDCTNTGLTEGSHCDICGEILVAQEEIAALGHSYSGVYTEATFENDAFTTYTCGTCGDSYVETEEGTQLRVPTANVGKLEAQTLKAGEYAIYNGSLVESTEDLPLEVVVNFSATETEAGSMADWLVDFNLTFTGMENGSIVADNCYLAGNYGSFGWIAIPTDGMVLEDGVTYPVVAVAGIHLNYNDIVTSVKDFIAAIHIDQAILDANPNLEVNLELVMTDPEDAEHKIQVGQDMIYTAEDLKNEEMALPEALVTPMDKITLEEDEYRVWNGVVSDNESEALVPGVGKLPLEVAVNFKAIDTLEECLAGGYAQWLVDFNITVEGLENGSFVADNCYLAGNYGSYGWIKIPLDGQTINEGVAYPVVALYDPTLNYKDICKSVKDFTAAIHIDQAVLDANPNITVKLELVMTNPNNANDTMQIGDDLIYSFAQLRNDIVAQNKDTGVLYTDLAVALGEAEDQTVILLSDITAEKSVAVNFGVTLDLNGYTLNIKSFSADGDSHIVDSTNGKGLLVVNNTITLNSGNAAIPVKTVDGYRFTSLEIVTRYKDMTDYKVFGAYFVGEVGTDATSMLATELADGGADNNLTVRVKLTYTSLDESTSGNAVFNFSDELVQEYAADWEKSDFRVNVRGAEKVANLQATLEIVAVVGDQEIVVSSETIALQ